MSVQILEKTDTHSIATWGRVMLLVWNARSTGPGIDSAHAHLRGWAKGSSVLINVVPPQPARPPDEETRAAMERATQDPIPGLRGVGTIYEGGGFIAAAIRSLVSRLQLLRKGETMRFFRTPEEAALWAAQTLGAPGLSGEGLAEAIRQARAG